MRLPNAVAQHLVTVTLEQRAPVLLKVTHDARLLGWDGDLEKYGLGQLQTSQQVTDVLFFLEGLFPLTAVREVLPCLQTSDGLVVDVHLYRETDYSWILLLDATAQADKIGRLQQKGNDLNLLRQQYSKLLQRSLQRSLAVGDGGEELPGGDQSESTAVLLDSNPGPSRSAPKTPDSKISSSKISGGISKREISVLVIKICESSSQHVAPEPAEILHAFNACLSIVTQIVMDEGGVLNHVLGDTAIALFGLLPTQQNCADQALYATRRMGEKFRDCHLNHSSDQGERLGMGMAITSGWATSGIVHLPQTSTVNAIGDHINRALQFVDILQADQILIDHATFQRLGNGPPTFKPCSCSQTTTIPIQLHYCAAL